MFSVRASLAPRYGLLFGSLALHALAPGLSAADFAYVFESEPVGVVSQSGTAPAGSAVTTPVLDGDRNGQTFAYWRLGGERQVDAAGIALPAVRFTLNAPTSVTAVFIATNADTDRDGVPDWYEWNQFGTLANDGASDPDGDGFPTSVEAWRRYSSRLKDTFVNGGVASYHSQPMVYAAPGDFTYAFKSEPAGFVDSAGAGAAGFTVITPSLHGETSGWTFAYWKVNGVRQADVSGVAVPAASWTLTGPDTATAVYVRTTDDVDGDNLPDWYELNQFGDHTQNGSSDPDGDGFNAALEFWRGYSSRIVDTIVDGGIASRRSSPLLFAASGDVTFTVNSEPAGLVTGSSVAPAGTAFTTPAQHGETGDWTFAYWRVNGVRQTDATGGASASLQLTLNVSTTATAVFVRSSDDTDSDGVPDWYEWNQFGTLAFDGVSDPDGDDFTTAVEVWRGYSSRIVDTIVDGGIASRRSVPTLFVAPSGPAAIQAHPADQIAVAGYDATFEVTAAGLAPLNYLWQRSIDNGVNWSDLVDGGGISGSTTATLSLGSVTMAMSGYRFRAVAANSSGDATSYSATLTVQNGATPPEITSHPANQAVKDRSSASFSGSATGVPTPDFRWQRSTDGGASWNNLSNGATISGVTSATLDIVLTSTAMDGHRFRLTATNIGGLATSAVATLTVEPPIIGPSITVQPTHQLVTAGSNVSFAATVAGYPTPSIQWQRSTDDGTTWSNLTDGSGISGATTTALTIAATTRTMSGHFFRFSAMNSGGSATSIWAYLTVALPPQAPSITAHPASRTVTYLDDPTFTVAASGSPTIQWQLSTNGGASWDNITNNAVYSGTTTSTLTVNNVTTEMTGSRLRAVATNAGGSATSNTAILTVNRAAAILALSDLTRAFTGSPLSPNTTTTPPGLNVLLTFSGTTTQPSAVGSYAVVATINDPNYQGSANGTFVIQPALSMNVSGTVNIAAGASITLTVSSVGGTNSSYVWQVRPPGSDAWSNIADATSASYHIPSAQRLHTSSYRVLVTASGIMSIGVPVDLNVIAPGANNARLLNLSTRGLAQTGANVLIPGFVISGSANKKLLIRAVGPTLSPPPFNLGNTVAPDPQITLKRLNTAVQPPVYVDLAANDNWQTNPNAADITTTAAQLFAFPFNDPKEAALLMDLAPGQYTVTAGDKNGTSGITIVELYDADSGTPGSRLINISNRGFCGVGDNVMIPGFVVSSEGPKTLLIRVVGPTLGGFGVGGTMVDPKLTVYFGQTAILANDNWSDNPDAASTAQIAAQVFAFALDAGSKDAALVVTLQPGSYTVVGSSAVAGGIGVVLVEVYVVP